MKWRSEFIVALALMSASAYADVTFTTVFNFPGAAAKPTTAVVLGSDGNFYGTTGDGGAIGAGAIYRLTPAGVVTTLYSFTDGKDGSLPARRWLKDRMVTSIAQPSADSPAPT